MLERDVQESNSQVRRMLSVCAEFERIAKVVLDKAERDVRGRGKKKQAETTLVPVVEPPPPPPEDTVSSCSHLPPKVK